jgi:hypothetical protein
MRSRRRQRHSPTPRIPNHTMHHDSIQPSMLRQLSGEVGAWAVVRHEGLCLDGEEGAFVVQRRGGINLSREGE